MVARAGEDRTKFMRLMIVDDHAAVRQLIRHLVTTEADAVCECASGDDALQQVEDFRPDTVTLDIRMPGLSWLQTTRALLQAQPSARVYVVTSHDQPDFRQAALDAGAAGYVAKDNLIRLRATLAPDMDAPPGAEGQRVARKPSPGQESTRIGELSAAVAMERVRQLERRVRELESYTGFVAHELRSPLLRLSFAAAALREGPGTTLTPEASRHLRQMEESVAVMQERVHGLWQLVRVEHGTVRPERVNSDVLVCEALAEACSERDRHRIEFRIESLPEVLGERGLLRLVFTNLLANAIKFSAHRSRPCVRVSAERVGANVLFCVRDNGVGFPPELAKELFQPFRRLHSAQDYPGTGLGLAVAHRIVTLHHGHIWAESRPDVETAFHILLPGAPRPLPSLQNPSSSSN